MINHFWLLKRDQFFLSPTNHLKAYLTSPPNIMSGDELWLGLHGCHQSSWDLQQMLGYSKAPPSKLSQRLRAVVFFEFAASDESSYGACWPWHLNDTHLINKIKGDWAAVIDQVLTHLNMTRQELNLSVFGFSAGGFFLMHLLDQLAGFKQVQVLSLAGGIPKCFANAGDAWQYLKKPSGPDSDPNPATIILDHLPQSQTQWRWTVVHGAQDEVVAPTHAQLLIDQVQAHMSTRLILIPGLKHRFPGTHCGLPFSSSTGPTIWQLAEPEDVCDT